MMGAGIATVAAQAGIEVVLIDRDQAAADKGRAHVEAFLDEGVKRKRTTPERKAEILARVTATPDYAALAGCDLVVEAVFEDPAVKAEATRQRGGAPPGRGDLRDQHLDPADQRARQGQPRSLAVHRPPLLLAGREDGAGRDHPRQGDRRPGRRQGARLRAADREDPDRRQRRPLLLRQPLHHPLHQRGGEHGRRRGGAGADRERGQAARDAARAAAARRRDLDRPRGEDRQGDQGGDGRRLSREPGRRGDLPAGRPRAARAEGEGGVLCLRRGRQAAGRLAGAARALAARAPSSRRWSRCSTGWR